jgi:hypothetical protein
MEDLVKADEFLKEIWLKTSFKLPGVIRERGK